MCVRRVHVMCAKVRFLSLGENRNGSEDEGPWIKFSSSDSRGGSDRGELVDNQDFT